MEAEHLPDLLSSFSSHSLALAVFLWCWDPRAKLPWYRDENTERLRERERGWSSSAVSHHEFGLGLRLPKQAEAQLRSTGWRKTKGWRRVCTNYTDNYCAALIKRRQQIRLLLVPNFACIPSLAEHSSPQASVVWWELVRGGSSTTGTILPARSMPTLCHSFLSVLPHPFTLVCQRIYFTTKQKISERLGLWYSVYIYIYIHAGYPENETHSPFRKTLVSLPTAVICQEESWVRYCSSLNPARSSVMTIPKLIDPSFSYSTSNTQRIATLLRPRIWIQSINPIFHKPRGYDERRPLQNNPLYTPMIRKNENRVRQFWNSRYLWSKKQRNDHPYKLPHCRRVWESMRNSKRWDRPCKHWVDRRGSNLVQPPYKCTWDHVNT